MCSSRKHPYSPHRRDWNFLGGGASVKPKKLKKCMKLNWNFPRGGGGGVLEKIPFRGGGMEIFWHYTVGQKIALRGHVTSFFYEDESYMILPQKHY